MRQQKQNNEGFFVHRPTALFRAFGGWVTGGYELDEFANHILKTVKKGHTMPNFTGERAEIRKTKSDKKPFSVRYVGKNGEPLAPSQNVTTRANSKKNIIAMIGLAHGAYMNVLDLTGKEPKGYSLNRNGSTGHWLGDYR